jgi:hypothetical protein
VQADGLPTTAMTGESGRYFAHVSSGSTLPATVQVTNAGDVPPTVKSLPVTDALAITRADYDSAAHTLTVSAHSSDQQTPPALTVTGFGPLGGGSETAFSHVLAPPLTVQVSSAAGGKDSEDVTGVGATASPLPVTAIAGPDQIVQQGQRVVLDGGSSQGAISSFSWQQVSGPAVQLTGADTVRATFTAPAQAVDLVFRLTATGPAGTSTSTVTVTVQPLAAPVANAGPDQQVPVGSTVHLTGAGSQFAATYAWAVQSGPQVTLTLGANTATPSFTMPTGGAVTLVLTVTGPGGAPSTDTVVISPIADQLTGTAEFRTSKQTWRIRGTATGLLPDTVTVTLRGAVLGTAPVDATGAWDVRPTGNVPAPVAGDSVLVTLTRGGSITVPVTIRN